MQDSNLLMYVVGEIALVLLAVCIFLCFHINSLKKLIVKLEEKISTLRKSVRVSRKETKNALIKLAAKEKIKPKAFLDYLDEEIQGTLGHHKSLNPDRDIVLDITPDAPLDRQAASLRHAFLIAEKEARYAGDEQESSWDVLQAKLQQIIQFYESAAPAEPDTEELEDADVTDIADVEIESDAGVDEATLQEIENYKKQIENLNRFKKLFFETDEKWQVAKTQAEDYYQQLMAKTKDIDDEEITTLLNNYAHAYDEVELVLVDGAGGESIEVGDDVGKVVNGSGGGSVGQMVIANQEEMQRLRNMAVDQHKVITELKSKLVNAKSPEEHKDALVQVADQLEKQQRFLKEAETCTQLIEDELSRTLQENVQLREQLETGEGVSSIDDEEVEKLETLVQNLTGESKEMLRTIAALEQDNQALREKVEKGVGNNDIAEAKQLKEKLSDMQQELLNMQTQHIELEERYLELKMTGD
jgi:uncharacterized protein YoxC